MSSIITIDGPSGSGKGTLATKLAQHYGFHLLDSGAIYRLLGLSLYQMGLLAHLQAQLAQCVEVALQLDIQFVPSSNGIQVLLAGQDVTHEIRSETVGEYASKVAVIAELRQALFERQRAFAQAPGLVADGRDMGTVVFPEAAAKLYLTASAQSRAERRVKQLQQMGLTANMDAILANIQARDARDTQRLVAPLRPADDAHIIDSSNISIDDVFQQMLQFIDARLVKTF